MATVGFLLTGEIITDFETPNGGERMFEYEKKGLLTQKEYEVLFHRLATGVAKTQTNYYFDTDDGAMNRKGITCRIRKQGKMCRATIKKHCIEGDSCSVEEDLYVGNECHFGVFEALGLRFQGELMTLRTVLHQDDCCKAVLDRNTYLGYTDYEIEVEYSPHGEQRALDYLQSIAQSLVEAQLEETVETFFMRIGKGKCKSERFFERKQQEGRERPCNRF